MQLLMSSINVRPAFMMFVKTMLAFSILFAFPHSAIASDFNYPWRDKQKAIVIDAYEKNPIDWEKMVTDKRIRGFIAKASDGMPSPWACNGNSTEVQICKKSFQNYWMKQQLYHTRKLVAKQLGLKWGAYHLGRPGNPIHQANHFLEFAKPEPDELIALDIEHDDPEKWISFKDAEIFARHIYNRIGRYPVLYTNHHTAQEIARRKAEFPLLSRMQLWYARFKGDVRGSFPMGNWDTYMLWQFSAHPNCNKRRCLYRVPGTEPNIDVNISTLSIAEFDKAWPFDGLVPEKPSDPEILMVDNNTADKEVTLAKAEDEPAEVTPQADIENIVVASIVPTLSPLKSVIAAIKPANENLKQTKEPEQSEESEYQIASTSSANLAVPSQGERKEIDSYGITTTEFEPEYEVVIPKSEHAEDLTMQLQYLGGAL